LSEADADAIAYQSPTNKDEPLTSAGVAVEPIPAPSRDKSDEEPQQKEKERSDRNMKKQSAVENAAPAMATSMRQPTVTANSAYYKNGEKALQQVVAEKLSAKNLLHRFDARLYISPRGIVDSVTILKSYKLTEKEQTEVRNELKAIEGFVPVTTKGQKAGAEYVLSFIP